MCINYFRETKIHEKSKNCDTSSEVEIDSPGIDHKWKEIHKTHEKRNKTRKLKKHKRVWISDTMK